MSVEQQISDAVTDFHDLIAQGSEISAALAEASTANGLKNGVLERHLTKRIPLQEIVNKIQREANRKHTFEIIYDAVLGYVSDGYKNWFKQPPQRRQEKLDRLEAALGHPPSSEELAQADAAERRIREENSIRFQHEMARSVAKIERRRDAKD
jgi:hypothetical protein